MMILRIGAGFLLLGFAQTAAGLGRTYSLRFDASPFYEEQDTEKQHPLRANAGSKFKFESDADTATYRVSFTSVSPPSPAMVRALKATAAGTDWQDVKVGKLYRIEKTEFDEAHYQVESGFSWGILTIPFKIRLDDGTLSGNSTLGGFVGYNQRWLFGALSVISISAGVSMIATQDINSTSPDNKAGFTWAFGITLPLDKSFQVGAFAGADHLGGQAGKAWGHDDKMWLSLGVGYAFLQ